MSRISRLKNNSNFSSDSSSKSDDSSSIKSSEKNNNDISDINSKISMHSSVNGAIISKLKTI